MSSSKKGFFQIATLSLLAYPISFINQLLLSYYFGTTSDVDAYFLSLTIINFFIFFVSPAQEVLTPKFFKIYSQNKQDGKLYLSRVLIFLAIPLTIAFLTLVIFPDYILNLFDDGETSINSKYVKYLVFLSPLVFLISITNIFNNILLSFNKYIFQNIGRILGTVFSLIFIVALARQIGIYALIYGSIFSFLVLLIIQLVELNKSNLSLTLKVLPLVDKDFVTKTFILLLGFGASQVAVLSERYIFINFGEGTLSGYQYAFNLSQIPQNIFIVAVIGAIWPRMLNDTYSSKEGDIFGVTISSAGKITIFFSFLSAFCFLYSKEIIYLIYFRGAFTQQSLEITNLCFKSVSLLFVPFGVSSILMKNLSALLKATMMTKSTVLSSVTGIICMFTGYYFDSLQIISLHPVVSTSSMVILLIYQVLDANEVDLNKGMILNFIFWLLKLIASIGFVYFFSLMYDEVDFEKVTVFMFLALKFIFLLFVFLVTIILFKLVSKQEMASWAKVITNLRKT